VFAVSVPVGTFLANLVPWWQSAHPAAVLYGVAAAFALVIGLIALLVTRWRAPGDPLAALGVICLFTVAVLGLDVMTGSRLQMETPFGLSVLEAGRFYGVGNEALGIYGITALFGAAWLGLVALRRYPSRRPAVIAVCAVAAFAVFASGWPGFGGKVGGTLAMVPCFALLVMVMAGIRLNWRRVLLVGLSGLALFAIFALISYFTPVTGKSDIGRFAGDVLHGHAGGVLLRKINSNIGSLSVNAFSPVIPIVVVLSGLMLWRPRWFALKTVPLAYAAEPLLRPVLAVLWLMPVLGWLADDSGVIVPAAALPLALPLGIAIAAAAAYQDQQARYVGTTVAGHPIDPPVAGSTARPR
jgi:energy-coupling factor transporter transmembrane protein EcfT